MNLYEDMKKGSCITIPNFIVFSISLFFKGFRHLNGAYCTILILLHFFKL